MSELAEREGFEPSVTGVSPYNGLAILGPDAGPRDPSHLQSHSITQDHPMSSHSAVSGHHSGHQFHSAASAMTPAVAPCTEAARMVPAPAAACDLGAIRVVAMRGNDAVIRWHCLLG
jgi:hypothetical protein